MRRTRHIVLLVLLVLMLLSVPSGLAQVTIPTTNNVSGDGHIRANRLGITFISSGQLPSDEERYQNALRLGAGWNRWPIYWNVVETAPGNFDWSAYDRVVVDDVRHGLNINAILLNKPEFYADGAIMEGLSAPVFSDGSDIPGPGKEINPNNPWAVYVFRTVQRYKPGGELARQQRWINGEGIRLWEVWNEPDLPLFWQGGIANYARLLKVAYLSAHFADPTATVMFGGLLYNTPDNWLVQVLALYRNDPNAPNFNWYMDAVALHSYSYPWRTGWLTQVVNDTLKAYAIDRPIFVNESGIGVWDDYPGPVWASSSGERLNLGTSEQQAWFFIQSTAYAYAKGAEVVFFHQLYDDCGDQPAGTNFPPHRGELCTGGQACFGDGFGLYRNASDSICYSQHPNPNSPRPVANAYRLMATVFGSQHFEGGTETRLNGITDIAFTRPNTNERIHVVWNRRFEPNVAVIAAEGGFATLHTLHGVSQILPQDGSYQIPLRAALPDAVPDLDPRDISAIGSEPVILIDRIDGDPSLAGIEATPGITTGIVLQPPATPTVRIAPTVSPLEPPTPGPVIAPPVQSTVAPENDTQPPITFMEPLPGVSAPTFVVRWEARDNGAIDRYVVWIRVNEGEWTPWLETQRTEGIYTGIPGNTYRFAVWAADTGGNWSPNTDLEAQAETRVE